MNIYTTVSRISIIPLVIRDSVKYKQEVGSSIPEKAVCTV